MSFQSGFVARSFFFLGAGAPSSSAFGYMEGTPIPYVPGSGTIANPTSPSITGTLSMHSERRAPAILGAWFKKRR